KEYVAAGISTDHECTTIDEAREKLALGMKILIREGSAAKNFEALWPLLREAPGRVMLCSDDKHPNDLLVGHIDALVRRAIAHGIDPLEAWQAASLNAVEHYRMQVGLLRPGDPADLVEVDDLHSVRVLRTWIDGRLVAERGRALVPSVVPPEINQFVARAKTASDFAIAAQGQRLRVIEALDGQLVTRTAIEPALIQNGAVLSDPARDVLKIALVDRYHDAPPAVAMINGFGLRRGAIASSVSHDSHNVVAVGVSDDDLARAVNLVIAARGGVAVAAGNTTAVLPLPVAGLMSPRDAYHVAAEYERLDALAKELGSPLAAPFMTLSFMALLVIPSLKLGPQGLFDVEKFEPVSLFV
ncbi:MAG TPA: adenine deaminase C-terminal domain-containing protein, partial [Pirellulales bacterium]|nr:adenine deaminase C-terminal domain-containing protein [Pirellulales bacterium]